MFLLEHPNFSATATESIWITVHSFSAVVAAITTLHAPLVGGMILTSIILSMEIPMKILLQFTVFASIQKMNTGVMDIFGGLMILLAVLLLPVNEFIQLKREKHDPEYKSILPEKSESNKEEPAANFN